MYREKYLLTDHLGSTRAELEFDSGGTPNITENHDLMPYGEEINPATMDSEQLKVAGKIRDAGSGLDNFGARYYSYALMRWPSIDPSGNSANISAPQTWNRYNYVLDNPVTIIDPDGRDPADFYDQRGHYLGNDGINNNDAYIVTNKNEAKSIKKRNHKGLTTSIINVENKVKLPPEEVRIAIGEANNRSNHPTNKCQTVEGNNSPDSVGGFHEEGLLWGYDSKRKLIIVNSVPGPYVDPSNINNKKISMALGIVENEELKNTIVDYEGGAHIHPSGTKNGYGFVQEPSGIDKYNAAFPTNIVVGARNKTVYFYIYFCCINNCHNRLCRNDYVLRLHATKIH